MNEKIYNVKIEAKVLTKLNKILFQANNPITKINKEKDLCAMDSSNVVMVVAKTDRAKRILMKFIENDDNEIKRPDIQYEKEFSICNYSSEYFSKIIPIIKDLGEKFNIQMGTDKPIIFKVDIDWEFILAPRCEDN